MDDSEIFALGGMTNTSKAMFDRRRRILRVTLKLIESGGLEGFNIRALSKRAHVAPRTIYNAFGSKENLIALAISGNFTQFHERMRYQTDAATLEGALDRWITAAVRNLENRHFPRVVTALYFSPTIHLTIREAILDLGSNAFVAWLKGLVISRQAARGVNIDHVVRDLCNIQFSIIHEWGVGMLDDHHLVPRLYEAGLSYLSGVTRGAAATALRERLADLRAGGDLLALSIDQAQARLAAARRQRAA